MNFFNMLGFYPEAVSAPKNYHHKHAGYKKQDWEEFSNLRCIVMARDPYLSAIRFLHNGQSVEDCVECWDDFLKSHINLDYFVLDLGVQKENRLEHLCQVADFIGEWPNKYENEIRAYANDWLPVKGTNNSMKQQYIQSGMLPANHNWSLLDPAVAWYKSLPTNDYEDK